MYFNRLEMKSFKQVIVYGFLIWLIPFLVSILIFPFKTSHPPLFESIMPVVLTATVVFFSVLYFKDMAEIAVLDGVLLGVIWFGISIILDLLMFMEGPMKMTLFNYMMDIGLTYLLIPAVTTGIVVLCEKRERRHGIR